VISKQRGQGPDEAMGARGRLVKLPEGSNPPDQALDGMGSQFLAWAMWAGGGGRVGGQPPAGGGENRGAALFGPRSSQTHGISWVGWGGMVRGVGRRGPTAIWVGSSGRGRGGGNNMSSPGDELIPPKVLRGVREGLWAYVLWGWAWRGGMGVIGGDNKAPESMITQNRVGRRQHRGRLTGGGEHPDNTKQVPASGHPPLDGISRGTPGAPTRGALLRADGGPGRGSGGDPRWGSSCQRGLGGGP